MESNRRLSKERLGVVKNVLAVSTMHLGFDIQGDRGCAQQVFPDM